MDTVLLALLWHKVMVYLDDIIVSLHTMMSSKYAIILGHRRSDSTVSIRHWNVAGAKVKPKGVSQKFKQTVMCDQGCFVPILWVKDNLPVPSLQIQFAEPLCLA